jgi:integrase
MTAVPSTKTKSRALRRHTYLEYLDLVEPGMYHDGGGLYLHVSVSGAKSWLYRYMLNGRARAMGLGSFRHVSLAKARKKVEEAAELRAARIDPLDARLPILSGDPQTFEQFGVAYVDDRENTWASGTTDDWKYTLKDYAYPSLGAVQPHVISLVHVRSTVEPLWKNSPKLAKRVLNRIEVVLDYAKAHDPEQDDPKRWRENPARWKGLWDKLKQSPTRIEPTKNLRAISYTVLGSFMHDLTAHDGDGIAVPAMELLILTAARKDMINGARWEEFDLVNKVWRVPAERMKNKKDFSIPLGDRAIQILKQMSAVQENDFVFPGQRLAEHIGTISLNNLLKKMTWNDRTVVHGFRSTFRSWAADETSHERDVCEMALAHSQGDATYAAYQRGVLLKKRRALMDDWNDYVMTCQRAA